MTIICQAASHADCPLQARYRLQLPPHVGPGLSASEPYDLNAVIRDMESFSQVFCYCHSSHAFIQTPSSEVDDMRLAVLSTRTVVAGLALHGQGIIGQVGMRHIRFIAWRVCLSRSKWILVLVNEGLLGAAVVLAVA